ncbi:MAG: ABC transporter ATP-binding protein [Burkholderiaceae bacterium]|jgi:peptide/nickel transport system ATP-binding protein|nr:ABC transporter ATP-binding protein [Burkholderiaceae bacterium]
MTQQLNVKNLVVDLQTESGMARAVDALNLTLQKGQTFALVGESGCGKSMTALSLLRLLPDNAVIQSGQVKLSDVDVFQLSENQMRSIRGRRISIIFQEPSTSLNPVMTVGDQILEVISQHTSLKGEAARGRALEWLTKVGLPEPARRMGSYPFEMSGGQLQRVMIAIALAAEPDLLIADEPTTALDVTIQAQILDLLKSLQKERGMAMLLITHDLAVVSGMADQVALMYAGQIVEVASAADFFVRPSHPYAKLLLQALPGEDLRGRQLAAIHGTVPALTQVFQGCRFAPRCPYQMASCVEKSVTMTALAEDHHVRCVRANDVGLQALSLSPLRDRSSIVSIDHSVLLSVQNLSVTYSMGGGVLGGRQSFQAVKNVSFDIQKGQTLALVGESGCGKTTIGKALLQLLTPQTQVTGHAVLQGQNLFQLKGRDLMASRRQLQIIFQNPFASLNPRMRVQEILEEGMKSLHPEWSTHQRHADLKVLMDQVGLRKDALDRYPHEFSGGQRQRIAIARALAVKPSLIVCDEPTSALDVSVQAQILNLLKELQDSLGVSFLFVTHNIGVVAYLADKVAVMHEGEIVEIGDASQILNNPQAIYTKTLLSAVPQLNQTLV